MSDPLSFPVTTPRFALPLLFAGQAQKEVSVNEALTLTDALLAPAIEGVADTPPASAGEGACWLIGAGASGDWAGRAAQLALWSGGGWRFIPPRDGLRVFDRALGAERFYHGQWLTFSAPASPAQGATIDSEARAAIGQIVAALTAAGIFSAP